MNEYITIAAIVLAPLLAFGAQGLYQFLKEKRDRKIWIFRALMSTRLSLLSPEHVKSLNLIDLEFNGNGAKNRAVREAWHNYLDQLNAKVDESNQNSWDEKCTDLRNLLLYRISERLRFGFQLSEIKKNCYAPNHYGNTENELMRIRRGLIELLNGNTALKMELQMDPQITEKQREQIDLSIDYLRGNRTIPVALIGIVEEKQNLVRKVLRESMESHQHGISENRASND